MRLHYPSSLTSTAKLITAVSSPISDNFVVVRCDDVNAN